MSHHLPSQQIGFLTKSNFFFSFLHTFLWMNYKLGIMEDAKLSYKQTPHSFSFYNFLFSFFFLTWYIINLHILPVFSTPPLVSHKRFTLLFFSFLFICLPLLLLSSLLNHVIYGLSK